MPVEESDLNKAAIVIQGVSQVDATIWKTAASIDVFRVILAGAADHRQYPNPEEDSRIQSLEDEEFRTFRSIARLEGYSLENPSLFFIQHVYATIIGKFPLIIKGAK